MPNNWKTYKLGDIIDYQKGYAFKSKWYQDSGKLIVRVSDTTSNSVDISTCHRISEENAEKLMLYELLENDIIIASVGSWPPNYNSVVGKVVKVPKSAEESLLNQNAVRLRTKDKSKFNQRFIYDLMKTQNFLNYIVNRAQGSASQASIKLTDIFDYKFNLPPIQEQKEIAQILSAIDEKIENNLAINKTLEEMAMALYKHWFVDFGPFQEGEFVDSELGEIPKGWEVKKIGDVINTLGGGTPKTNELSYWENGDVLWYSPTDLTRDNGMFSLESSKKITNLGLQKSSAKLFPAYSLLMSSRATIGALTINTIEASTNQGFITMIPNDDLSIFQLYNWTKSNLDLIISKANGSTFKEISKTNFRNLEIVVGTNIEQYKIEAKSIFNKIENSIIENQTLTKLRDTLLPKLISGEIRLKEFQEKVEQIV